MDKLLRIMGYWFYGIWFVLLINLSVILIDFVFGAGLGFKASDVLIVGGAAVFMVALYFVIRLATKDAKRR